MILLNYGVNQMYLTISESNTFDNPLYFIDITDETVNDTKRVTILDTSIYATRYNQFEIEVTNNYSLQDLDNGVVYLNEGRHKYNVYTSPSGDYPEPKPYLLCETGFLQVNKVHSMTYSTYSDNIPTSFTYSSYSDRM